MRHVLCVTRRYLPFSALPVQSLDARLWDLSTCCCSGLKALGRTLLTFFFRPTRPDGKDVWKPTSDQKKTCRFGIDSDSHLRVSLSKWGTYLKFLWRYDVLGPRRPVPTTYATNRVHSGRVSDPKNKTSGPILNHGGFPSPLYSAQVLPSTSPPHMTTTLFQTRRLSVSSLALGTFSGRQLSRGSWFYPPPQNRRHRSPYLVDNLAATPECVIEGLNRVMT